MGFQLPLEDTLLQFTLLVAAALAVQLTIKRLHLPGLVGLLLIGILLGPDGLHVLPKEPVVNLLGHIGLVYIMFLAGVEINLDVVRRYKYESIAFGTFAFLFTFIPAVLTGLLFGFTWGGALLLGTALSSHTLLAYPIVESLGLVDRRPVVAAIGGTLLTDTVALVLLAIVVQSAAAGGDGAAGWVLPLVLLAAVTAVSLAVVPRLGRFFFALSTASRPEKALFVLSVLLVLASITEVIGTEAILGAFLAGVCLNRPLKRREELHEHLGFVGQMMFIPFFFIQTGMRLDLAVFAQGYGVWLLAGAMLAVVGAGKGLSAWTAGRLYSYRQADRWVMFGLTIPQAAATLAVTVTAARVGLFDVVVVDAIIAVIFVTCMAGPLVTRIAGRRILKEVAQAPKTAEEPVKDFEGETEEEESAHGTEKP